MAGAFQFALIGMENVGAMTGRLKAAGFGMEGALQKAMVQVAHMCYEACVDFCRGMVYMNSIGENYVFTGTLLNSHYIKPLGALGEEGQITGLETEAILNTAAESEWSQFGFSYGQGQISGVAPSNTVGYIIGNNANQGEGGYAPFVHDGTFSMFPRPWMEKAIMATYQPATDVIDNGIQAAVKGPFR
jgi:hypothetical protein